MSELEDVWLPHTSLELRSPDGPLAVHVSELHVHSRAGIPLTLNLELILTYAVWARVSAGELLHLASDARGPGPEPKPTGDVRVEVGMDDDLLADVFTGDELTAEDAWRALRSPSGDWERALDSEAWFALRVRQDLLPDAVAAGFVTRWAMSD